MGYFPPANVYHNPTILLLKPIALLSFWLIISALRVPMPVIRLAAFAVLNGLVIGLATIAKPNYTLAVAPALLILVATDSRLRNSWRAWAIAGMVAACGCVVLAWQYWCTYGSPENPGLIFGAFLLVVEPGLVAMAKLLLSIAFPLCVLIGFFRTAMKSLALRLAWLSFLVACAMFYSLAEAQPRSFAYNFAWGCQITNFLLFVFSLGFLIERLQEAEKLKESFSVTGLAVCFVVYGMHLACGILFFLVYWNRLGDTRWM
jgi:hypothetical protein